jgi:hypothetical protein
MQSFTCFAKARASIHGAAGHRAVVRSCASRSSRKTHWHRFTLAVLRRSRPLELVLIMATFSHFHIFNASFKRTAIDLQTNRDCLSIEPRLQGQFKRVFLGLLHGFYILK